MAKYVKLENGVLDEFETDGKKVIVIRGMLTPESFSLLKTAPYQREVLSNKIISKLMTAFKGGRVDDIELGLRSNDFFEKDGAVTLKGDVYTIDGLQRVTAGLRLIESGELIPRLWAVVHINTTPDWERERFRIKNQERAKLSATILLRNKREDSKAMQSLYELTFQDPFVLCQRVCWNQLMKRQHLIRGTTYVGVVGAIHHHLGGNLWHRDVKDIIYGLETVHSTVGDKVLQTNTKTFFDLLEEVWGITNVEYREGATYLNSTFLYALAHIVSSHTNFWRGHTLVIDDWVTRKIKTFAIKDPYVTTLASTSGKAGNILYQLLVEHIQTGQKQYFLRPRKSVRQDIKPLGQ